MTHGKLFKRVRFGVGAEVHLISFHWGHAVYSGTRLIWTPRGHAEVSVLSGVRIKCVNMDTKGTCRSVHIMRMSVLSGLSGKNVSETYFVDMRTKPGIFSKQNVFF